MSSNYVENLFAQAIRSRKIQQIMAHIKKDTNINIDAGGIRVFDAIFSSKKAYQATALNWVLDHPNWNPNYRLSDGLHPEERAMIHGREDIALRIIQHPNFDRSSYPRVIQSATVFKAPSVLHFLSERQHQR